MKLKDLNEALPLSIAREYSMKKWNKKRGMINKIFGKENRIHIPLSYYRGDRISGELSKPEKYEIVVTNHPYDIAGQSSGRSWRSSKNIEDDSIYGKQQIHKELGEENSFVAYVVRKSDGNIQRPVGRMAIRFIDGEWIANEMMGGSKSIEKAVFKSVREWMMDRNVMPRLKFEPMWKNGW